MKALSLTTLLIFLSMYSGGLIIKSSAVSKYYERSKLDFREREQMKEILDNILAVFNEMVNLSCDYEQHPILNNLRANYTEYNIEIKDISSGCNLNFLPSSKLSDRNLSNYLFVGGNAENFLKFRRTYGFVTDIALIKDFIKEEAQEAVVCNGWLSSIHVSTEIGSLLAANLGRINDDMYPIANDMPLINVNNMELSLLGPLLSDSSWRIPEIARKIVSLKNRLEQGAITEGELHSLLNLGEAHEVYKYLGVRTAFWGISYKKGNYCMDAVIAAVPARGSRNINSYTIIEGKLSREY